MWDDLAARARGLAAHLIAPDGLTRVDRAASLAELAHLLGAAGYPFLSAAPPSAPIVERAARRRAAADLAVLGRWARERGAVLAMLFEDEDRRSVRALVRGAAAGAPPDERVASLVPTPALGEAALAELSRQPTTAAVGALLVAWGSPYGRAIADEAARARPDLLALEHALDRCFAARALRAARRAGAPARLHVRGLIDAENAFTALAFAGTAGVDSAGLFLDGGARLPRDRFAAAVAVGRDAARAALATAFAGTRLGHALADDGDLEAAALADRIDEQRRLARLWPTGLAPVILLVLRRRAEIRAVNEAAWRVALTGASS
jgi:vacuolar-type H+-ATPase subunit C/Vma6